MHLITTVDVIGYPACIQAYNTRQLYNNGVIQYVVYIFMKELM